MLDKLYQTSPHKSLPDTLTAALSFVEDHPNTQENQHKPSAKRPHPRRTFRTVFISDTHLGTKSARVDLLYRFLKETECETLYLVGDIIDGWRLKKSWYWDTKHNDVIRRILKMAKHGTKVIYVPGNHDEAFREFTENNLAGVELQQQAIHTAADGRRYWVLHGDEFDGVVLYAKWLAHLGDTLYTVLLKLNQWFNFLRRKFGYSYWSLSAYLKHKVKNAVEYIGKFEEAVANEAKKRGVDGVICGHIHHAEIRQIGDITYMNDGDWVESCTALTEDTQGQFSLINYADEIAARTEELQAIKREKKKRKKKSNTAVPVAAE